MFKQARIKLTAWYLVIIMAISLSFSLVIFTGVSGELTRIEASQRIRIQRIQNIIPTEQIFEPETAEDFVSEARTRIILTLGVINLFILVLSGMGGYFLAGRTLEPISKMVEEQKEFVSNASHELRTPLTVMKTEIEVGIRNKKITPKEARELIESNLEEVNKMQALSNYLLRLGRYESEGKIPMVKVDLKKVALNAIGKMKVTANLKKSIVMGNEDALVELVTILLDNAVRYNPKGTEIGVNVSGGVIEVYDRGIGIAKEDLPHIFDRFYRGEVSRSKEKTDGYGLGLAIAKSIVELHKGKIEAESKVGKGTTFRVEL